MRVKAPNLVKSGNYIDDPIDYLRKTDGLLKEKAEGSSRTEMSVQKNNKLLSAERNSEVDKATTHDNGEICWQH